MRTIVKRLEASGRATYLIRMPYGAVGETQQMELASVMETQQDLDRLLDDARDLFGTLVVERV